MGTTEDRNDPRLTHGPDIEPAPMAEVYLVKPEAERITDHVRPYRDAYMHDTCGMVTRMARQIAETYAADPAFYGATYCVHCRMHRPVGANGEFTWLNADGEPDGKVGT